MSTVPVSVVIGCHTADRWVDILNAIDSARRQDPAPAEIIVVVDHNAELFDRLVSQQTGATVLENAGPRGASSVRNTGARRATSEIVAFLDDDASARPGWLANLVAPLAAPEVVGTGGWVEPAWRTTRPPWFPDEFGWVVGASYAGMPGAGPIRNAWAENMAVRRTVFMDVGGFREDFGKVGGVSRPEDTDICIRMSRQSHGGRWIHAVTAVVDHAVPAERARLRYFLWRSYLEGRGKVEMGRLLGRDSLGSERAYSTRVLPRAVLRDLGTSVRRRTSVGLRQAGAICLGTLAAGAGALVALASRGSAHTGGVTSARPAEPATSVSPTGAVRTQ